MDGLWVTTVECIAGQAVVQFATNKQTKQEVAIKFFLFKSAFDEEVLQYGDADSPLREFLPPCFGMHANADGRCAPSSTPLYRFCATSLL